MFTLYSKPNCPFCDHAKNLLDNKKIEYKYIQLDFGQSFSEFDNKIDISEFKALYPNQKTLPLILDNDGSVIGGFQELLKLKL